MEVERTTDLKESTVEQLTNVHLQLTCHRNLQAVPFHLDFSVHIFWSLHSFYLAKIPLPNLFGSLHSSDRPLTNASIYLHSHI